MQIVDILVPTIVALVYISLCFLFKEPHRRSLTSSLLRMLTLAVIVL
jgi:hypothetical protein